MSRKLRRAIVTLEHERAIRIHIIKRMLSEHRDTMLNGADRGLADQVRTHREMERVIGQYFKLQKKLKRLRRKA